MKDSESELLVGSVLLGFSSNTDTKPDTLYRFDDSMDLWFNSITLQHPESYRMIRLQAPASEIALCEISFYDQQANQKVQPSSITTSTKPALDYMHSNMLCDGIAASGYKGTACSISEKAYVDFGFEESFTFSKIDYVPYTGHHVYSNCRFELFYWDHNGWVSCGVEQGSGNFITFTEVPEGCLYMVKNLNWKPFSNERIFLYEDGMAIQM